MRLTRFVVLTHAVVFLSFWAANAQVLKIAELKTFRNLKRDTVIGPTAFSKRNFEQYWNYLYPWGPYHNGTAKMSRSNISLLKGNILKITANRVEETGEVSTSKPYLPVRYISGAIHAKSTIEVTNMYPRYEVGGYFKAPISRGTWPAFWLTSIKEWPPEIDILEFKGDKDNWQNTFNPPHKVFTRKKSVFNADKAWHHYKVVLQKLDDNDISIAYYVDSKLQEIHRGINYLNKPLWLIINLQMEGAGGEPGPVKPTNYLAKNIVVVRSKS